MKHLEALLETLHQHWQAISQMPLYISEDPEAGLALTIPVQFDDLTFFWLQSDDAQYAAILQSWALLLGRIVYELNLSQRLTMQMISAWDRLSFYQQLTELRQRTIDPWQFAIKGLHMAAETLESENGVIIDVTRQQVHWISPQRSFASLIIEMLPEMPDIAVYNGVDTCRSVGIDAYSVMVQHIRTASGTAYILAFLNTWQARVFTAGDMQIFETLLKQIITVTDIEAFHQRQLQADKVERSLAIAAQVQANLLPREMPMLDGYDFAVALVSALQVGGDFYDIFQRGERVWVSVNDVSGKGISAALMAANVRAALRSQYLNHIDPDAVLFQANAGLYEDLSRVAYFVTSALVLLSEDGASYASAGHTPILWWQAQTQQLTALDSTTLPLGILDEIDPLPAPIYLQDQDVLLLYSDGLTEAENKEGEMLGEMPVKAALLATRTAAAAFILESLQALHRQHLNGIPALDDLTILVIKKAAAEQVVYQRYFELHGDVSLLPQVEIIFEVLAAYLPATHEEWRLEVQLAMAEIVTNIFLHGYARQPGHIYGMITLTIEQLRIDLVDLGLPFEFPEEITFTLDLDNPQEGGYGLHIIQQVMDEARVQRMDVFNVWRFTRRYDNPLS